MSDQNFPSLDKIRWATRRGMLELDLLFAPYVENCYLNASAEDKQIFIELLLSEDQDLFGWFLKSVTPPTQFQEIITKIMNAKYDHNQHL